VKSSLVVQQADYQDVQKEKSWEWPIEASLIALSLPADGEQASRPWLDSNKKS
jgi:hypothetical protein